MKKKNNMAATVVVLLLLLLGVGLIVYPTVCDMYYKWAASREISQYNQVAAAGKKDYSELWTAAAEYNRQLAEDGRFFVSVTEEYAEYVSQFLNPLGTGMMGYIDIPSIDVHIPIYQGTEETVLQSGAGHWLGTSLPAGGESTHCVITAHNGLVKAKLFTDLDKVEVGDTFSLSILDRVLTYEVDQILITEPDDFTPMQIIAGEDLVTLYTCYPYGVNSQRLLVRGHRVEESVQTAAGTSVKLDEQDYGQLLLGVIILCDIAAMIIIKVLYEKHRYKGKRAKTRQKKGKHT